MAPGPLATTQWEKRNIALEIPVWDAAICIQCNKCAMVCPHAAIRAKVYEPAALARRPATFKTVDYKGADFKGQKYTIQVAPEDCTGCTLCVEVCPAKDKSNPKHKAINMAAQAPLREAEAANYKFFLDLPEADRTKVKLDVKGSQFLEPLFEFSGACAGCGETPYVKLLTQLFGDRPLIANATGCSSHLRRQPAHHALHREQGRPRPGLGQLACSRTMRSSAWACAWRSTSTRSSPCELLHQPGCQARATSSSPASLTADQTTEAGITAQRERVASSSSRSWRASRSPKPAC